MTFESTALCTCVRQDINPQILDRSLGERDFMRSSRALRFWRKAKEFTVRMCVLPVCVPLFSSSSSFSLVPQIEKMALPSPPAPCPKTQLHLSNARSCWWLPSRALKYMPTTAVSCCAALAHAPSSKSVLASAMLTGCNLVEQSWWQCGN